MDFSIALRTTASGMILFSPRKNSSLPSSSGEAITFCFRLGVPEPVSLSLFLFGRLKLMSTTGAGFI